jgi:hypothetical protein
MRYVVVVVAMLGCGSSHEPPRPAPAPATLPIAGSGSGGVAEPILGGTRDDVRDLPFVITNVVPGQQPTGAPPWHAAGGTWTYFEAHVDGDDQATFAALVPSFDGGMFGKMQLVPTTSAGGARVVAAFAKAFHVLAPPPAPGQLQPMPMHLAVLGLNTGRDDGFSGAGTWTATKWFCTTDSVDSAEVFFNFSLAEKKGELSEKDADYDADIATCLATALRDGQPPPRTPANDPTLATTGPTLVLGKKIAGKDALPVAVTAARILLGEDDGARGSLIAVDPRTAARTTLLEVPDRIMDGACNADASVCAIHLSMPSKDRNEFGGDDPSRLVVVTGSKITPVPLDRPSSPSLSPDASWIATTGKDELAAWNRKTRRTVRVPVADKTYAHVYGWKQDGGHAVALVELSTFSPDTRAAYVWDLDGRGTLVASADAPPGDDDDDEPADPVSPDRTRKAELTADGTLIVTPLPSGAPRRLVFHPNDRRAARPGCCKWLDNRYLELRGRRYGFIDTDAMKVSFVPHTGEDEDDVTIAPGMALALVRHGDGMYLATITKP